MKKSFNYLMALAVALACTTNPAGAEDRARGNSRENEHPGRGEASECDQQKVGPTLRNTGGVISMFLETKDAGGNFVPLPANAPDGTLLWGSHANTSLYAPDGHQLTWGEYKTVQASASATCVASECRGEGTSVRIHASGLVPGGVYTIWVLVFNGPFPAAPPAAPFANLVGVGALGINDGRENSFQASANGRGEINAVMPPGIMYIPPTPTSPNYDILGCLLDETLVHLVGVYHSDGKTYGPVPGYANHAEVQFGVELKP